MTFRARVLVAFSVAALVPLIVLTLGVRAQLGARVATAYGERTDATARVVREDLVRERTTIGARLAAVARALADDDEFRLGAVRGDDSRRAYVLDFAARAMGVAGLTMLQLQDSAGRIVSSGHFRNEFDRPEGDLLRAVISSADTAVLVRVRTPDTTALALVRTDSLRVGGRKFYLIGGVNADIFVARAQRGDSVRVAWDLTNAADAPPRAVTRYVPVRFVDATRDSVRILPARLSITQSLAELEALQRDVNRWLIAAVLVVVVGVLLLAAWLSSRLTAPLADLANAAGRIDLDGDDVLLPAARDDEIGTVARRLSGLTARLRASAGRLRDAERRATTGDLARQVNHDIKNGLIPIRNVLRHLGDINEKHPGDLSTAFAERRGTLDASVEYLDTLARNYARLTPQLAHGAVDVNAVVRDAAASAQTAERDVVRVQLAPSLPRLSGDAVVLRRIVENLIRNAIESIESGTGSVVVTTSYGENNVIIQVADTGRGMSDEECAHAFDDFFTTKPDGTGLGLSVVRRLTADLRGSIHVQSVLARGTTFTLEFPV